MLSLPVGPGPPAEGPVHARGLRRRPTTAGASTTTSSRPTTRRSGACPPPRSRPTGAPSASRTCRCGARSGSRSGPRLAGRRQDKAKQVTSLIEEFQYPKYGPGHDVGARAPSMVEAAGLQGASWRPRSTRIRARGRPGRTPSSAETDGVEPPSTRPTTSSRRCRSRSCSGRWTRRCPAEVLAAADDLRFRDFLTVALVVPEDDGFPDNWIYIHVPRASRSAASRTSARGRRTW